MSNQTYFPQTAQVAFTPDVFDFGFADPGSLAPNTFPNTNLSYASESANTLSPELNAELLNMCFNLSTEEFQHMMASLSELQQETQPVLLETSDPQQEVLPQAHESTANVLPQLPMIVPSQSSVTSQPDVAPVAPIAPAAPVVPVAPVDSSSNTPYNNMLLKASTVLKLNMRFNHFFQNMGIVSCPDSIDLKAGMKREDAMVAAGYLPQTLVSWDYALKILGKQGFCAYYYSEVKKAKGNNIELPPLPEWIVQYCFSKRAGKKPAVPSKESPASNPLNNQQQVAKVMLARNNPTRKSKVAAASGKNKGKAVQPQRFSPYARQ